LDSHIQLHYCLFSGSVCCLVQRRVEVFLHLEFFCCV
jgi:hypothetical protein